MKTLLTILAAGSMLAAQAQTFTDSQPSEERFRAKYGRYTPAEETRRKMVEQAKSQEHVCADHCCHRTGAPHSEPSSAVPKHGWMTDLSAAKFGRATAPELRRAEVATSVPRMSARPDETQQRLHAKLGIHSRTANREADNKEVLTAMCQRTCEMPCCSDEVKN